MFKSYRINFSKSDRCFVIVDSEFEVETIDVLRQEDCLNAIINVYSQKNLNVAKNIALFLIYLINEGYDYSNCVKAYFSIPSCKPYIKDIQKYLILK